MFMAFMVRSRSLLICWLMARFDSRAARMRTRHRMESAAIFGDATPEQASEMTLSPQRRGIWWPLLDEGLYLPDFLAYRWGKELQKVAA